MIEKFYSREIKITAKELREFLAKYGIFETEELSEDEIKIVYTVIRKIKEKSLPTDDIIIS